MNLILLGAPGSGKGTLADYLVKDYNIPHISTGDIFRENIKNRTEIGIKIEEKMKTGELISDDITIQLVKDRLSKPDTKNGFILDGFPRNLAQAEELEKFARIDNVILLEADNNTVINRLNGRRVCPNCKSTFNIVNYIKNTCNKCGEVLVHREDDKPETVKNRLEVYKKQTAPLIDFYSNKILRVDGTLTAQKTYEAVKASMRLI